MFDGLWTVKFQTNLGLLGQGVVVLVGTRVLGGDTSFYYDGYLKGSGELIEGEITVIRFAQTLTSVFGNLEKFRLVLSGKVEEGKRISLKGHLFENPNMKITVTGEKKAEI